MDPTVGQLYESTDKRRPVVGRIVSLDNDHACLDCDGKSRRVRIDRLTPKSGWRLAENGAPTVSSMIHAASAYDQTPLVAATRQMETATTIAAAERSLNPALVLQQLEGKSIDELVATFREAKDLGARAWMTMALCVSSAQRQAGYGDGALESLAKSFDIHRGTAGVLGQIGRDILEKRVTDEGSAVLFPLTQQAWYALAVKAAAKVEKPAVELLAEAESRIDEKGFSARKWGEELGVSDDDGSTTSAGASLGRWIARSSKYDDDDADDYAASVDAKGLTAIAEALALVQRVHEKAQKRAGTC